MVMLTECLDGTPLTSSDIRDERVPMHDGFG